MDIGETPVTNDTNRPTSGDSPGKSHRGEGEGPFVREAKRPLLTALAASRERSSKDNKRLNYR
eukprot:scaffold144512_cov22-Tisochrysis_lutea.AAC.1